jgi:hypothetical protein
LDVGIPQVGIFQATETFVIGTAAAGIANHGRDNLVPKALGKLISQNIRGIRIRNGFPTKLISKDSNDNRFAIVTEHEPQIDLLILLILSVITDLLHMLVARFLQVVYCNASRYPLAAMLTPSKHVIPHHKL